MTDMAKSGLDGVLRKARVLRSDGILGHSYGDAVKNHAHGNTCAPDTCLPVKHRRIDGHEVQYLHRHIFIILRSEHFEKPLLQTMCGRFDGDTGTPSPC